MVSSVYIARLLLQGAWFSSRLGRVFHAPCFLLHLLTAREDPLFCSFGIRSGLTCFYWLLIPLAQLLFTELGTGNVDQLAGLGGNAEYLGKVLLHDRDSLLALELGNVTGFL